MTPELPSLFLGPAELSSVENALSKEWLIANGLGGYASSTILGVNTRKYHGLLVGAADPPLGRRVLLAKLDDALIGSESGKANLAANEFTRDSTMEGLRSLRSFSLCPFPTYTYEADGVWLSKGIALVYGSNVTLVRYEAVNLRSEDVLLEISPLVTCRSIFTLVDSERSHLAWRQQAFQRGWSAQFADVDLWFAVASDGAEFSSADGAWVKGLRYRTDEARGDSHIDDCYTPGFFTASLSPGESKLFHILACASESQREVDAVVGGTFKADEAWELELARRRGIVKACTDRWARGDWAKWLALAADAFIVRRARTHGSSVIAGYHWFGDWGRDTLISLPGLLLVTGRYCDAERVLLAYGAHEKDGLIPNFFAEAPAASVTYNSVDASLWYIDATLQYVKYTGNLAFVRENLWPGLASIIEHYSAGTQYGIHMDKDGLICHGPRLTWMDAAIEGLPVTSREGKAVEIQALWYNALSSMALLARGIGEDPSEYEDMAGLVARSFREAFWNQKTRSLYDVVEGDSTDARARPNQILAASLDYSMLEPSMTESVVRFVWRELWTVYGLRTLCPGDPAYRGACRGSQRERDLAYHNGTIWPWLTGPFVRAFLRTKRHDGHWRNFAYSTFLRPLLEHGPYQMGLGFIAEAFDGDPPHRPGGCIAQAWSTAEPLRAYVEDVLARRPPFANASTWPRSA